MLLCERGLHQRTYDISRGFANPHLLFFSLSAAAETEQQQLERDWKGRKKGGGNDCFLPFSSTLACTLRPLEREKGEEKGIDRRFLPFSSTSTCILMLVQLVAMQEKGIRHDALRLFPFSTTTFPCVLKLLEPRLACLTGGKSERPTDSAFFLHRALNGDVGAACVDVEEKGKTTSREVLPILCSFFP